MTDGAFSFDFDEPQLAPPSGRAERFGGRWRLIGAGLSNVWRYGDLELPAASGRLLMRGANGTGKTTALEALWPYLLDLDAAKLAAGKSRRTSLTLLMSDGATTKRRYGYAWLTFAPPAAQRGETESAVSFGVRLQYSAGGSPAVKPMSFWVPGRPLGDLSLYGAHRSALELEEFTSRVADAGGHVFGDDSAAYVEHRDTCLADERRRAEALGRQASGGSQSDFARRCVSASCGRSATRLVARCFQRRHPGNG